MKFNDLNYKIHFEKTGKDNLNHPNVYMGDIKILYELGTHKEFYLFIK